MKVPENITVNAGGPDRYDLACTVCQIGWTGGATFGPVSGADLAASFIVLHATHDRKDRPTGLTPGGKPRPAALAAIRDLQEAPA